MRNRVAALILILVCMWFVLPMLLDLFPKDDKSVKTEDFEYFYDEKIAGKIESINFDRGRIFLRVDNKRRTYVLYPLPREKDAISTRIAIGDSLIKSEDSKFFLLKKEDNTIYKYEIFISND